MEPHEALIKAAALTVPHFRSHPQGRTLQIYVDGGCRPNPGRGAAAVCIREKLNVLLWQGFFFAGAPTTCNQMEYLAYITALIWAGALAPESIEVFTDSRLMCSQLNGDYQTRNPILERLRQIAVRQRENLRRNGIPAYLSWCPRESNIADLIVNELDWER